MARDIEEFLRRAAERRKQKQSGQKPSSRQPVRQQKPPTPRQQPRLLIDDDEVRVIQPKQPDMRHESLEQHVRRHMDTRDVSEHASHLAETLEQADERMEERLNQKFDHEVGTFEGDVTRDAATVDQGPISQVASDMIELINNPKTLRQAIIMSEILNRPNFDSE